MFAAAIAAAAAVVVVVAMDVILRFVVQECFYTLHTLVIINSSALPHAVSAIHYPTMHNIACNAIIGIHHSLSLLDAAALNIASIVCIIVAVALITSIPLSICIAIGVVHNFAFIVIMLQAVHAHETSHASVTIYWQ